MTTNRQDRHLSDKPSTLTHTVVVTTEFYQQVPGKKNLRLVETTVRTEEHYTTEVAE